MTDSSGTEVAFHSYYPFGGEATDASQNEVTLKFTGHERDANGGSGDGKLDYMHARYCSPSLARFLSVDPKRRHRATRKPQRWNRYAYAHGNPLTKIDPDGRDALAVTFVGYRIPVPQKYKWLAGDKIPGGHSGIAAVSKSGDTTYFEFGRYPTRSSPQSVQYRGPFDNLAMGSNGLPTQKSLKAYAAEITGKIGQNKPIEGAYFVNDEYQAMVDYARGREANPAAEKPYSLRGNNCATFCQDVLRAGGEDIDDTWIDTPDNVIEELQGDAVFYFSYSPDSDEFNLTCNGAACPE